MHGRGKPFCHGRNRLPIADKKCHPSMHNRYFGPCFLQALRWVVVGHLLLRTSSHGVTWRQSPNFWALRNSNIVFFSHYSWILITSCHTPTTTNTKQNKTKQTCGTCVESWVYLFAVPTLNASLFPRAPSKSLPCKHACHTWDLRFGTLCEVVSPNFLYSQRLRLHGLTSSDLGPHVNMPIEGCYKHKTRRVILCFMYRNLYKGYNKFVQFVKLLCNAYYSGLHDLPCSIKCNKHYFLAATQWLQPGEITPSYILHTCAFGTYLLSGLFTLQKRV
jgi:hypothetical protein